MNFDDKSMKQLRRLILFTIVILIALWNYAIIFGWIRLRSGYFPVSAGRRDRFCAECADEFPGGEDFPQ